MIVVVSHTSGATGCMDGNGAPIRVLFVNTRSALGADVLAQMGFTNVCSMAGGIAAWKEAKLPIEK